MANFYTKLKSDRSSRDPISEYAEEGKDFFPPFFELYTCGLRLGEHHENPFTNAARYGRPLFALLAADCENGLNPAKEELILSRMLIEPVA
jgi:hypothetical protein